MQFKLIFNHTLLIAKKCSIATTFEVRLVKKRSSKKEHKGNALAPGADEGRDKLRKAAGKCK